MQNYRKLTVWQKSHQIVLNIYHITMQFPNSEKYGLTSQMRRAASSIPANIAEGSAKGSDKDYARFLHIALGSCTELDYHILLARDLNYITSSDYEALIKKVDEVGRMLNGFIKKLKASG